MRGHNTRLRKLDKRIVDPQMMTITIDYANGDQVSGLPMDAALDQDQDAWVTVKHGELVCMTIPMEYWTAL